MTPFTPDQFAELMEAIEMVADTFFWIGAVFGVFIGAHVPRLAWLIEARYRLYKRRQRLN